MKLKDIQVIVTDMDGTLLNSDHQISEYTRNILIELQEQGKSLILASGRDIRSLKTFGQELNLSQYPQSGYISLNGLGIYNSQGECLHQEKKLSYEDAVILDDLAKQHNIDIIFFFDHDIYILEHAKTRIMENHFVSSPYIQVERIQDIPASHFENLKKIAYLQFESFFNEKQDVLNQLVEGQYELTRVEDDWIEINPYGVSKGHALHTYSEMTQIPLKNIIAFGNGENDISMLQTAGLGIAMENAFENVKAIADDVCLDHNHDGIGVYLKNL